MALTTLIGFLMIGATAKQEPIQVSIETKVYKVADKSLKLEGTRPLTPSETKERSMLLQAIAGIDDKKLAQNKGLKLQSAPTIRTLNGMEAKLSMKTVEDTDQSVTWTNTYSPYVRDDGQIDLDLFVGVRSEGIRKESASFSFKPRVKAEEPIGLLVAYREEIYLYVIKVYVDESTPNFDARVRVTRFTGTKMGMEVRQKFELRGDVISAEGVDAQKLRSFPTLTRIGTVDIQLRNGRWRDVPWTAVVDKSEKRFVSQLAMRAFSKEGGMNLAVEAYEVGKGTTGDRKFREDFTIKPDSACVLVIERDKGCEVLLFELIDPQ